MKRIFIIVVSVATLAAQTKNNKATPPQNSNPSTVQWTFPIGAGGGAPGPAAQLRVDPGANTIAPFDQTGQPTIPVTNSNAAKPPTISDSDMVAILRQELIITAARAETSEAQNRANMIISQASDQLAAIRKHLADKGCDLDLERLVCKIAPAQK